MKLGLSDFELDILIHVFDDLMNEASNQRDLCAKNDDYEELAIAELSFNLYWKMLSYLRFIRKERNDA